MGSEFLAVYQRLDPAIEAEHRNVALHCVNTIIGDGQGEKNQLWKFSEQHPLF
jgi:hypothetical protein